MKNYKSGKTSIIYMFNFSCKVTVFEAHCHMINNWCSCLDLILIIFVHFRRDRDQEYIL